MLLGASMGLLEGLSESRLDAELSFVTDTKVFFLF